MGDTDDAVADDRLEAFEVAVQGRPPPILVLCHTNHALGASMQRANSVPPPHLYRRTAVLFLLLSTCEQFHLFLLPDLMLTRLLHVIDVLQINSWKAFSNLSPLLYASVVDRSQRC